MKFSVNRRNGTAPIRCNGIDTLLNSIKNCLDNGVHFIATDGKQDLLDISPLAEVTHLKLTDEAASRTKDVEDVHIEGDGIERVTPEVVDESLDKAADNTPLKTKTEMREWLTNKIDSAIAKAGGKVTASDEGNEDIARLKDEHDKLLSNPRGQKEELRVSKIKQEIAAIHSAQLKATNGQVTFDVPGDGKFSVLNTKEHLSDFKKKVLASSGFREGKGHKTFTNTVATNNSAQTAINNFIKDGELDNAYYAAQEAGIRLGYASIKKDGIYKIALYTDIEPVSLRGDRVMFVGRRFANSNGQKQGASIWHVIDEKTGITLNGMVETDSKKQAINAAQNKLALTAENKSIDELFKEVEGKDTSLTQSQLEEKFKSENSIDSQEQLEEETVKLPEGLAKATGNEKNTVKGTTIADKAEPDIKDFGEVLAGAKKHTYTLSQAVKEDIDVASVPLSKSFPQPDYEKLIAGGVKPQVAALIAQLRAELPTKPQKSHKLSTWVTKVNDVRRLVTNLLDETISIEQFTEAADKKDGYIKYLTDVLKIADSILPSQIKDLGPFKLLHTHFSMYDKVNDVWKWEVVDTSAKVGMRGLWNKSAFTTKEEALAYIKERVSDSTVTGEAITKFDVWSERGKAGVFVGKKVSTSKYIELKHLDSTNEARAYIRDHNKELVDLLKQKKSSRDVRRSENNQRIGKDYRNGKNITAEQFTDVFGFRGIQFGNWVNNDRRQQDLNNAYDGLMDLADVLGLPPKALALNGELGLAFGARGTGGIDPAAAHYEPSEVVINLTKVNGAGSLAHEWWHAVDNYFGKMESRGIDYLTEGNGRPKRIIEGKTYRDSTDADFQVRKEVFDAWQGVTKAIKEETQLANRSRIKDKTRSKDYWSTVREMTARTFERYVIGKLADNSFESDYLANIIPESAHDAMNEVLGIDDAYVYPLQAEMDAVNRAYDKVFGTVKTKETDKGTMLYSRSQTTRDAYDKRIDELFNGEKPRQEGGVTVLDRSDVLGLLGYGNEKMNVVESKVLKSSEVHRLTADHWKQIPEWLENPVAVFKSDTVDGRLVFIAPELLNGQPILMIVEPNAKEGRATVNLLVNSYDGSAETMPIQRWVKQGKLLYINNEKSRAISAASRLQLPTREQQNKPGSKVKILTEKNLVKRREQQNNTLSSKSTTTTNNPHTKATLHQALSRALDKVFGQGWMERLMATGKFKLISRDEAGRLIGPQLLFHIEAKYSKNGDIIAFYNPKDDTTYFVHDNISQDASAKDLLGLVLHEVGVHALQMGKSNEAFQALLKRFEAMQKFDAKVKAAFARVPSDTNPAHVTEEALAYYLENNPTAALSQRFIEAFRKMVRAIGNHLKGSEKIKFFQWANKLTETELQNMAIDALRQAPDSLQFDNAGRESESVRLSAKEQIEQWIRGELPAGHIVDLGNPLVILKSFGMDDFPIHLTTSILNKAKNKHTVDPSDLINLADAIQNPIAVFSSKKGDGHLVVLTELKHNDGNIIAAIDLNKSRNNFEIHDIRSLHPKDTRSVMNWIIEDGLLLGYEKTKGREWLESNSGSNSQRNQVIAALEDARVYEAEKNSNNDIRFSRTEIPTTAEINTSIREAFQANKGKQALGWLGGLFQRNHLIDFAAKDLPELNNYKLLSQEKDNFINQHEQYVAQSYKEMADKLDKKTMHELGRVQGLATRLDDFDPATFDTESRDMNTQESEVYTAYKAMPQGAKEVYAQMRNDYKSDLKDKRQALIERIEQFPADRKTKASIVKDIEKHFDKFLKRGVYFPLSRHGDIVITATNQEGARVKSFVETPKEKDKLVAQMKLQGLTNISVTGKDEYNRELLAGNAAVDMAALAHRTIGGLREKFRSGQTSNDDFDAMYDEFNKLLINTLPDSSYRKHFIHRKGTLGESTDTLRAYAKTRTSAIKNMAALKYDNKIQQVLTDASKNIKAIDDAPGDSDTYAIKSILNELTLRETALKNTNINAASQTLTSLGFMGALGFNVASAAVNMLQVVGMALPELTGRYSFTEASGEIGRAYQMLFNPAVLNRQSGFDLSKNPLINATTKAALLRLHEIGKIDMTMTHDSIAMGQNPSYSSNAITRAAGSLAKYSGYFFHVAEAVNRQVTGMAAFNLAYKKSGDFEQAITETIDVIDRTQFDYGQGNRARYMMSNTARVLTLFKSYALGISYYIGRNMYNATRGEAPEIRLAARKMLVTQMAMTFATSGLFGLPIGIEAFAAIGGVAGFKYKGANFAVPGAIGGMLIFQALLAGLGADDEDDLETEFRNWLTDNFDQTTAEWVTKGPARLLPIGDIAGRTGLSSIWYQGQNKQLEGKDKYNALANAVTGPLGSQTANMFVAMKMAEDGEWSRMVEAMSPRALSNIIAAARMENNGVANLKGDKLIDRELTTGELINKVIGFNPTVITNTYDANSAITKVRDKISMKKSHLVNRYIAGNGALRMELMSGAIADFNKEVSPQEWITMKSLMKSMKSRKSADKHTKNGLYLSQRSEYLRDIGRFAEE